MCYNATPIHTEHHAGFKIEIWHDEDASNPATDHDIPGEYTVFDNREFVECSNVKHPYTKQGFHDDCSERKLNGFLAFLFSIETRGGSSLLRVKQVDPKEWYEFGQERFDGIYIVSPTEIVKEWGIMPTVLPEGTFTPFEMAVRYAKSFLQTMGDYYNGNCYGFKVIDSDGEEIENGSCWGFIGDYDGYILEEAKSRADAEAKSRADADNFAEKFMCC